MERHLFMNAPWSLVGSTKAKEQKELRRMAQEEIRKNGLELDHASLSYLGNGLFHYGYMAYDDFVLVATVCCI